MIEDRDVVSADKAGLRVGLPPGPDGKGGFDVVLLERPDGGIRLGLPRFLGPEPEELVNDPPLRVLEPLQSLLNIFTGGRWFEAAGRTGGFLPVIEFRHHPQPVRTLLDLAGCGIGGKSGDPEHILPVKVQTGGLDQQ
ncbi:MAG: hypothetical protein KDN05_07620 [Verrucomicrobiae bacterium]|nr:hypothetical protein [Verrucomicrobiae bacterium]